MKLFKLIFCTLLFLNVGAYAQNQKQAYDFKGIRLGITLNEFKQLPIPQVSDFYSISKLRDEKIIPTKAVCTDGESKGINLSVYAYVNDAEKKFNGVNCEYGFIVIAYANTANPSIEYKSSSLVLPNATTIMHTFRFIQTESNVEPILYLIKMNFPASAFEDVANGLKEKFGKPKSANQVVQNKMGGIFNNTVLQWDNSLSAVVMERYWTDVNNSGLVYFLKKENALINKIEQESKRNLM